MYSTISFNMNCDEFNKYLIAIDIAIRFSANEKASSQNFTILQLSQSFTEV